MMTKIELEQMLEEPGHVMTFDKVAIGAMFRVINCKYDKTVFQKTANNYSANCERYWIGSIFNQLCHEEDCCQSDDLCVVLK